MPKIATQAIAVFLFQLEGCVYQPPAGDQTCLGIRLERWSAQFLGARPGASTPAAASFRALRPEPALPLSRRYQSAAVAAQEAPEDPVYDDGTDHERFPPLERFTQTTMSYPSPLPERALKSAKLAALHSRLSLSPKLPLQTLARSLVDATADENPEFNNSNLAFLGQTLINYHVAELLMCRYPRLPMGILYEGMNSYAGSKSLHSVARSWGIESAAVPGGEVDPGLLQFDVNKLGQTMTNFGYQRTEAAYIEKFKWRRGISSRVVFDDDFGNMVPAEAEAEGILEGEEEAADGQETSFTSYGTKQKRDVAENAHANAVRAVVGAIYAHAGRDVAKSFVKAHILTRQLDPSKLFSFKHPTRELALLCAREDFEPPVARLLSETGRLSRTPVYVVGIFSGKDKLGEAAGPSLDHARFKAAMNALKAWYLYSPGEHVRVPSDMLEEGAKSWEPPHIDIGEVLSR
ncbi:60S ribosomal protein L3-like protein [Thozetella sp. PMI_491]|nr:60S ribosomal protein L3-like protein [Thozetella sp. PMI_491]